MNVMKGWRIYKRSAGHETQNSGIANTLIVIVENVMYLFYTVNWFNEQFTWNQIHRLYNISRIIASRLSLNVICFKLNHKWLNYKTMKLFIYLNVVAQSVRVSVLISSVVTTLRWQGECGGQRWWWGRSRGEYTGRYGLRVMSPCTGGYKEYLAHLTQLHFTIKDQA